MISVVVPVYGDIPSLEKSIESLIKFTDPRKHRIIFVNDKGPQAGKMRKILMDAVRRNGHFKYYENNQNLGFIKTCNRAIFDLSEGRSDVLLLNSDAALTQYAIEEMQKVLYRAPDIASVSPRSNNATIFSMPFYPDTGKIYSPKKSYELYSRVKSMLPTVYETPTTHGFCMMIRRSVIDEIGLFDEVYGKGYGEENDFCMRARRSGYTHAIANHAYVFHEGSKSFTGKIRKQYSKKNSQILNERYPEYDLLVESYVKQTVYPELQTIRSQ